MDCESDYTAGIWKDGVREDLGISHSCFINSRILSRILLRLKLTFFSFKYLRENYNVTIHIMLAQFKNNIQAIWGMKGG